MYLGKNVEILLKGQAKEIYLELQKNDNKKSKSVLNSIERIKNILKENPQYGDPIKKDLIPKEFYNFDIHNLYRIELPDFWRMLYTLEGNEDSIFVFVLKIIDYDEYNKLFGYRKK